LTCIALVTNKGHLKSFRTEIKLCKIENVIFGIIYVFALYLELFVFTAIKCILNVILFTWLNS